MPRYVSSAFSNTLFLSNVLQHSFVNFLSHHYSHRITVFKVARDHSLFGPPLWYAQSTHEALTQYDDSASQPSSHDLMFREWNDKFHLSESDPQYLVFTQPASRALPDFSLGCLIQGSRYLQSACFQLITGHAFYADYSDHFGPGAGDNTSCPYCRHRVTPTHIFVTCPEPQLVRLR